MLAFLGVPCATPLKICQGASSSKGIDKEFGGLGQEAIQRFWTFLAGLKRFNPQK